MKKLLFLIAGLSLLSCEKEQEITENKESIANFITCCSFDINGHAKQLIQIAGAPRNLIYDLDLDKDGTADLRFNNFRDTLNDPEILPPRVTIKALSPSVHLASSNFLPYSEDDNFVYRYKDTTVKYSSRRGKYVQQIKHHLRCSPNPSWDQYETVRRDLHYAFHLDSDDTIYANDDNWVGKITLAQDYLVDLQKIRESTDTIYETETIIAGLCSKYPTGYLELGIVLPFKIESGDDPRLGYISIRLWQVSTTGNHPDYRLDIGQYYLQP